jgi:hypothetical protein
MAAPAMAILLLYLLIVILPAGLVLAAPRNWVRAAAGWSFLVAGWVYIHDHVHHPAPYDDDFMDLDLGLILGVIWSMTIAAALAARQAALRDPNPKPKRSVVRQWIQCWSVPIALLFGIAFLHWLSNRLAGATPALRVHLWVLVPLLGLMLLLAWGRQWRMADLSGRQRFSLALPAAVALLTVWDVHQGFSAWSGARAFAAGRPYCLMTYGGFEHRREAQSGWEMSPLVDRAFGNWAVAETPTLSVATADGVTTYRLLRGAWRSTKDQPQCWPGLPPADALSGSGTL